MVTVVFSRRRIFFLSLVFLSRSFFFFLNFICDSRQLDSRCLPSDSHDRLINICRALTLMQTFWSILCNRKQTLSHNVFFHAFTFSLISCSHSFLPRPSCTHIYIQIYRFIHALLSRRLVIFYRGNRKVVQDDIVQALDRRNATIKKKKKKVQGKRFQLSSNEYHTLTTAFLFSAIETTITIFLGTHAIRYMPSTRFEKRSVSPLISNNFVHW